MMDFVQYDGKQKLKISALYKMQKSNACGLQKRGPGHTYAIMMSCERNRAQLLLFSQATNGGKNMVRQVKISNFAEVQGIVSAATKCRSEVGVHDTKGSVADAKSILGMMSLDFSQPVKIVCDDENELNSVVGVLNQ